MSSSNTTASKVDDIFSFKFTESGGLTARYLMISFDSKTNTLSSSTDISGSNMSKKPLSDHDRQEIKGIITKNEFFNKNPDYPPQKEDPSLIAYSLAVTIDNRTHTTTWTNESKEMPAGIAEIVDEIRRIAAKANIV
jgi:hypothetical protein